MKLITNIQIEHSTLAGVDLLPLHFAIVGRFLSFGVPRVPPFDPILAAAFVLVLVLALHCTCFLFYFRVFSLCSFFLHFVSCYCRGLTRIDL